MLSPQDLREHWQGGVDVMFKAISLALMPVIYLAIAVATRYVVSEMQEAPPQAVNVMRRTHKGGAHVEDEPIHFVRVQESLPEIIPPGDGNGNGDGNGDVNSNVARGQSHARTAESLPAVGSASVSTRGGATSFV